MCVSVCVCVNRSEAVCYTRIICGLPKNMCDTPYPAVASLRQSKFYKIPKLQINDSLSHTHTLLLWLSLSRFSVPFVNISTYFHVLSFLRHMIDLQAYNRMPTHIVSYWFYNGVDCSLIFSLCICTIFTSFISKSCKKGICYFLHLNLNIMYLITSGCKSGIILIFLASSSSLFY